MPPFPFSAKASWKKAQFIRDAIEDPDFFDWREWHSTMIRKARPEDGTILSENGNDQVQANRGHDMGNGGSGHKRLGTDGGYNTITAGNGHDFIWGGSGDDAIDAGDGHNRVWGGRGDDRVTGGSGNDRLFGGGGEDTAVFEGSIFDYLWDKDDDWLTIEDTNTANGDPGRDQLHGFEALEFDDFTLDLLGSNAPLLFIDPETADEDVAANIAIEAWDFDGGTLMLEDISVTGGGNIAPDPEQRALSEGTSNGIKVTTLFEPGDAYNGLGTGQSATETVTVTVSDGQGNIISQSATLIIEGRNDAPEITAVTYDSKSVTEDGEDTATGRITASDIDAGDVLSYVIDGVGKGDYGTLSVAADGSFFYLLDNNAEVVQAIADGESRTDSFNVKVTDGQGGSDSVELSFNVLGADEVIAPVQGVRVLDFEALSDDGHPVTKPDHNPLGSYGGFEWNLFGYFYETNELGPNSPSGFHAGAVSGDNVGFSWQEREVSFSRAENFDFESLYMAAVWNEALNVEIAGYDDGVLIGKQMVSLNTQAASFVELDDAIFDSVDEIVFTPLRTFELDHFVMDDLTIIG